MWEPQDPFFSEFKTYLQFLDNCPTPCLVVHASGKLAFANPIFLETFEAFLPFNIENLQHLNWIPLNEEGQPVRDAELNMELLLRNLQLGVSSVLCTVNIQQPAPIFRISVSSCCETENVYVLWIESYDLDSPSSDQHHLESSLTSFEKSLSLLYSQLLRVENVIDALQAVCRHLHLELQCTTAFALQAAPELKPVAIAGEWGRDYWEDLTSGGAVRDAHPALLAFLGQKLVHIRDSQSVPELDTLQQWCRTHQIGSILALPISTSNQRLGVLCLLHSKLFAFAPQTVRLLEQLATDLAQLLKKIDNFEQFEQCHRRFSLLQTTTQNFASKNREFVAIFEFHKEKISWRYVAPACMHLLEIADDRLNNLPNGLFSMLSNKRQQEHIQEKLLALETFDEVWEFQTGKGQKRFFHAYLTPHDAPNVWDLLCVDITEIVQMRNACRRSLALWKVVANVGEQIKNPDFKTYLPKILEDFGKAAEASRAYIFENHIAENGEILSSQWMEWAADGITPQIHNPDLQAISFVENGFQRWIDELGSGRPIVGNVIDFPVNEQDVLFAQNILSIAVAPIFVNESWWGFLGLDECLSTRQWSEPEIESLRTAAAFIGTAISYERSRSENAWLEQQFQATARRENTGKLAHSIAHQFNNLLAPILGYISVALYDLPSSSPLAQDLKQVFTAAERAKELAHQLLRFGTHVEYRKTLLPADSLLNSIFESFFQETHIPVQIKTANLPTNVMIPADVEHVKTSLFAFLRRAFSVNNLENTIIRVSAFIRENPNVSRQNEHTHFLILEIPTTISMLPVPVGFDSNISNVNWSELDLIQAIETLEHFDAKISIISHENAKSVLIQYPVVFSNTQDIELERVKTETIETKRTVILVVEDEDAVRNFVVRALAKQGYTLLDAPDPQKALTLLQTQEIQHLDLLVTDVIMPYMSGKRLYQELKKTYPQLRVIYMSGYTANLLEKQGVPAEKRNFLPKPFSISNLLKLVEETLMMP